MAAGRKRHNYAELAERALEMVNAQGLSENAASIAVAQEVDSDNQESVARGIRRAFLRIHSKLPLGAALVPAGFGVLLVSLEKRIELMAEEVESRLLQTEEQFEDAASKAALIRSIAEKRLLELKALEPKGAEAQARSLLAGFSDRALTPAALVAREIRELEVLTRRARDLQLAIDLARPNPTWSSF